MIKDWLKKIVFNTPFLLRIYKQKLINRKVIEKYEEHIRRIDDAEIVLLNTTKVSIKNLKVGLVKDMVFWADANYISVRSYYPKYERFLRNNNINYEYYDIKKSDWIEKAAEYDVIIWHTDSDPATQQIAQNRIFVLERILNKRCLPSFDEIWSYEDKINAHYLFRAYRLPEIPTYVSHSLEDARSYINSVQYPIISKLSTGSASFGVEKLSNKKQALKVVKSAFSVKGRKTYFPFMNQKDYVYFQEYMDDATYDLRIITVGNIALGYYRYPNKGDFRASGAGNYEKKHIPSEALDLAFEVKRRFGSVCLATDLLYSEKKGKYYIIESSIFIGVDTPSQLEINGQAGYYERLEEGKYEFIKGNYWLQELTLKELFSSYICL